MEPFNWSLITRESLCALLKPAGGDFLGKKTRIDRMQCQIRRIIKTHLPVMVRHARCREFKNAVMVGGAYYSDLDRKKKKCMEIGFFYGDNRDHVKLTAGQWHKVCLSFADTVLHEIIHMRQNRARKYKTIPGYQSTAYLARQRQEQEYLGNRDEIGAYAFNIACEMQDRFGQDWNAIKRFMDSDSGSRIRLSSWRYYMKTFDWNHDHVVIRRLKRKVAKYFPQAAEGRPFKTAAHLTR